MEAVPHCEAAVRMRPENAQACNNLGLAYLRLGRVSEGVKYLRRSVELRPNGGNASLTLAWVLATSPDQSLRNGDYAVVLAERVAAREQRRSPGALHTLAAALAEVGNFETAIATAEEALRLAKDLGDPRLVRELELNLTNYRNHLPLRDPGLVDGGGVK